MRAWLFHELSPFSSYAVVAILGVAVWVLVIVPLWRVCRSHFISLSTLRKIQIGVFQFLARLVANKPLIRWVERAAVLLLMFAVGLWVGGRHKETIPTGISNAPLAAVTPSAEEPSQSSLTVAVAKPVPASSSATPLVATDRQQATAARTRIGPLATPAAAVEKNTGPVKPAIVQRKAPKPTPAIPMLSSALTTVTSAPWPVYPYQLKVANIAGSGVCGLSVDRASGKVTSAVMVQSTGNAILDKVTTDTFRRWRFKPGTVSQVRVPISYEPWSETRMDR